MNSKDISTISRYKLVERLDKGLAILKRKVPAQEVAARANISPGFLSRFRKPEQYNLYPDSYLDIFKVIDELVLTHFERQWNDNSEEYEIVGMPDLKAFTKSTPSRLTGLSGKWSAYCWNEVETLKAMRHPKREKKNFFDFFKVEISGAGEVLCITEEHKFTGNLSGITEDRISIFLNSKNRRMSFFGEIGLQEDLSSINDVLCVYADSGNDHNRCGTLILKKFEDDEMEPSFYADVSVKKITDDEKEYLTGKQISITRYNF